MSNEVKTKAQKRWLLCFKIHLGLFLIFAISIFCEHIPSGALTVKIIPNLIGGVLILSIIIFFIFGPLYFCIYEGKGTKLLLLRLIFGALGIVTLLRISGMVVGRQMLEEKLHRFSFIFMMVTACILAFTTYSWYADLRLRQENMRFKRQRKKELEEATVASLEAVEAPIPTS